ncbi:hypothetical protein LB452_06340 [Psychroflexus sp. CAK8W]|uniref:Uncharacterized protein n=1 Tax=Psychroflexus longus TaxID=2873596 RepID=A0ABS7XHV9_9FLAO|nr:hypothetical protein [Psychroflexus longus]MBZ9778538.1 hypothetical protein [Psychroflexus longus]
MTTAQNRIIGIVLFIIGLIMTLTDVKFTGSGFIAGALMGIGVSLIFFIKIGTKKH